MPSQVVSYAAPSVVSSGWVIAVTAALAGPSGRSSTSRKYSSKELQTCPGASGGLVPRWPQAEDWCPRGLKGRVGARVASRPAAKCSRASRRVQSGHTTGHVSVCLKTACECVAGDRMCVWVWRPHVSAWVKTACAWVSGDLHVAVAPLE